VAATKQKQGITIYRASDAIDLSETDFMTRTDTSEEVSRGISESVRAGVGTGSEVKVLVRDAGGFSLVYLWFKANYPLPRHSHNVDCLYYVISGSAVMGSQTLHPGDSFFVPAGAPYQYSAGSDGVEVLEVRHGATQFDIKLSEAAPARWQAMAEVVKANRDQWAETVTSPTYSANSG
jgi:mannose-6-phosphate isomerase-like protein (cupin superfamily)